MKTKYHILLVLLSALLVVGCKDDDEAVPQRNELSLSVSAESLVLEENESEEDVLTFSWNKATSLGPDYTFSYLFQLDVANNDFKTATDPVVLGENGSIGFTSSELYNLIVEKWNKTAGEPVLLEARVAAKVDGPKFQYPEIATAKVTVTTFVPRSLSLYIMGSATPGGIDPAEAEKMTELSNGRLYNWKGQLKKGSFKFITTLGSLLPSYNKGEGENELVKRESENDPDNCFEISEAGAYYIYLSLKDMNVSYKKILYENMYLVGDATAAGWELSGLISMTPDNINPNVFVYQGALKEGTMKILTQREWNVPTFKPLEQDGSITEETVQVTPGETPDYKWKVTADQAGLYKITLDTEKMTIKFEKQ